VRARNVVVPLVAPFERSLDPAEDP
jgi:hypothetical protein